MASVLRLVYGCLLVVLLSMVTLTEQRYLGADDFLSPPQMGRLEPWLSREGNGILGILTRARDRVKAGNDIAIRVRKRQPKCYWSAISCS